MPEGNAMKHLLCLGDSLTDCGHLLSFPPYGNGYVRLLKERLEDWRLTNRGFDGFTVGRLLSLIEREGLPSSPDVITILIGINDVGLMMNTQRTSKQKEEMVESFLLSYEELITILTSPRRRILLMEPFIFHWPDWCRGWVPQLSLLSQGIRQLAADHQLPYVQLQAFFEEQADALGVQALTTDGIHLTETGHRLLADRLLPFLLSSNCPSSCEEGAVGLRSRGSDWPESLRER